MEDIFKVPNQYSNFLWFYAGLSILIIAVYAWFTYKFVKHPVDTLLTSFRYVEAGKLDIRVQEKAASEFNNLFEGFNKMVFHLNELIDKVYREEFYAKKAELKQLQSQINPHFLYNTYFLLYWMFKDKDMDNAESLALYLDEYFQYIARNASEMVRLHREVEHSRNYAQIQQMRFAERLTIEFGEIPDKFRELLVPRIILQPIVENAFEHGLKTSLKNGLIRMEFEDMKPGLLISVNDSGSTLQDGDIEVLRNKLAIINDLQETTGIVNIHMRIVLKFGSESGLMVSQSELGGLRVEIRIILESDTKKIE